MAIKGKLRWTNTSINIGEQVIYRKLDNGDLTNVGSTTPSKTEYTDTITELNPYPSNVGYVVSSKVTFGELGSVEELSDLSTFPAPPPVPVISAVTYAHQGVDYTANGLLYAGLAYDITLTNDYVYTNYDPDVFKVFCNGAPVSGLVYEFATSSVSGKSTILIKGFSIDFNTQSSDGLYTIEFYFENGKFHTLSNVSFARGAVVDFIANGGAIYATQQYTDLNLGLLDQSVLMKVDGSPLENIYTISDTITTQYPRRLPVSDAGRFSVAYYNTDVARLTGDGLSDVLSIRGNVSGFNTFSVLGEINDTTYRAQYLADTPTITNMPDWLSSYADMFAYSSVRNINFKVDARVTNISSMFAQCQNFDMDVSTWDVSNVTDMSSAFQATNFAGIGLNTWDTSNVTDMSAAFYMITAANGANLNVGFAGIADWNTSKVENFQYTLASTRINVDISKWDVSAATNLSHMFYNNPTFNQDISGWSTTSAVNMAGMFSGATVFNSKLTNFDTSNVTLITSMFYKAYAFNQPVSHFNISRVTDLTDMFRSALEFDQPINNWDVSNVLVFKAMFAGSPVFNQDLSGWDTSKATNMDGMFNVTAAMAGDLSTWCVPNILTVPKDFSTATSLTTVKLPVWGTCYYRQINDDAFGFTVGVNGFTVNGSGVKLDDGLSVYVNGVLLTVGDDFVGKTATSVVTIVPNNDTVELVIGGDVKHWRTYPSASTVTRVAFNDALITSVPPTLPNYITDTSGMFLNCALFNDANVVGWNVSNVTDISGMFQGASLFNQPIGDWDVSNVIAMASTFNKASSFNQPLLNWNTSEVRTFKSMFEGAAAFNQDLSDLNTTAANDLSYMFKDAVVYNRPINIWNTSNVTDMSYMFEGAKVFNQDLNLWHVANVVNFAGMFKGAIKFNQDLSGWDTSKATNMSYMFNAAPAFNTPLDTWNISKVTNTAYMFSGASKFNQPFGALDVSSVLDMTGMFSNASVYSQPLNLWCVTNIVAKPESFDTGSLLTAEQLPVWGTCIASEISPSTLVLKVSGLATANSYAYLPHGSVLKNNTEVLVPSTTNSSVDTYIFVPKSGYILATIADGYSVDFSIYGLTAVVKWPEVSNGVINYSFSAPQPTAEYGVLSSVPKQLPAWVTSTAEMFANRQGLSAATIASWDMSKVTSTSGMFRGVSDFNLDIGSWNTGNVTDMSYMFENCLTFNKSLNNWDTSNVLNMAYMFSGTSSFNSPINSWNVGKVTTMSGMFRGSRYNSNLREWDVSKVTDMSGMFAHATSFNQPLLNWNTSEVRTFKSMFEGATAFNQPLYMWDVSKVTTMSEMFLGAISYNQPLVGWNTTKLTNMSLMFSGATAFNSNVSTLNTSNVTDMRYMFSEARAFNADIGRWDTSNVTSMMNMFNQAKAFNQPLMGWDVSKVTDMSGMFNGASAYNQPIINWDMNAVKSVANMFRDAISYNSTFAPTGLASITNMDNFLYNATSFDRDLSTLCILGSPTHTSFDYNTKLTSDKHPVWGTCPNRQLTFIVEGPSVTINAPEGAVIKSSTAQAVRSPDQMIVLNNLTHYEYIVEVSEGSTDLVTVDVSGVAETSPCVVQFSAGSLKGILSWFTDPGPVVSVQHVALDSNVISTLPDYLPTYLTDTSYMFYRIAGITDDGLSHWNTRHVTTMSNMFADATGNIPDISSWNVSNVQTMDTMFYGAVEIIQDLSAWCVSKITSEPFYFSEGASHVTQPVWGTCPIRGVTVSDLVFETAGTSKIYVSIGVGDTLTIVDAVSSEILGVTDIPTFVATPIGSTNTMEYEIELNGKAYISISAAVDKTATVNYITYCDPAIVALTQWPSTARWFSNLSSVRRHLAPTEWFVGERVNLKAYAKLPTYITDTSYMFYGYTNLKLSFSGWNTANVTDMSYMFAVCGNLTSNIDSFNLTKAITLSRMFRNCTSIASTLSSWATPKVTDMSGMFYGVSDATKLNISAWDTSAVTSMREMFYECVTFNLSLNSWNVSNVTDFTRMFQGAATFNGDISNWNTESAIRFDFMFSGATAFNGNIGSWNVSSAEHMANMFYGAVSFKTDLSLWCVAGIATTPEGFATNSGLVTSYVPIWGTCPSVSFLGVTIKAVNTQVTVSGPTGIVVTCDGVEIPLTTSVSGPSVSGGTTPNWKFTFTTTGDNQSVRIVTDNMDSLGSRISVEANDITAITRFPTVSKGLNSFTFSKYSSSAEALSYVPEQLPTYITDMSYMFYGIAKITATNITNWDTSRVTNMTYTFANCEYFNLDISKWVTANVANMAHMFSGASSFSHDLSTWCVSKITSKPSGFETGSSLVNAQLPVWGTCPFVNRFDNEDLVLQTNGSSTITLIVGPSDVVVARNLTDTVDKTVDSLPGFTSSVNALVKTITFTPTDALYIIVKSTKAPIEGSTVLTYHDLNMVGVVQYPKSAAWYNSIRFNKDSTTGTRSYFSKLPNIPDYLTNLDYMFQGITSKIPDITKWNTRNVISMIGTFKGATGFNQNINAWITSRVTSMESLFQGATTFNSPLYTWSVSSVTSMNNMFQGASVFNQDMSDWCVENIYTVPTDFSTSSALIAGNMPVWGTCPYRIESTEVTEDLILETRGGAAVTLMILDGDIVTYQEYGSTEIKPIEGVATNYATSVNGVGKRTTTFTPDRRMYIRITAIESSTSTLKTLTYIDVNTVGVVAWPTNAKWFTGIIFDTAKKVRSYFTKLPNLPSYITSMERMFAYIDGTIPDITTLDVSHVTTMYGAFENSPKFNQDISGWDTSNVTDMSRMFRSAAAFNQPIGRWDTSKVTTTLQMFYAASKFNQPLNSWNMQSNRNISYMFTSATTFNQPLNDWDVSGVLLMDSTFNAAKAFNQPLDKWYVGNATNMMSMFYDTLAFSQDLSKWCVSKITSKPSGFNVSSALTEAQLPVWGTCSRGY